MRSMKTLGVFLLLGMAAVALAATPAWANFNPCEDLEGAAQEACVDRYTVESPPQRAYSDEETRWRAENDALRQEIIEAVLDDYRNLETWKERLEFIRALREDAQQARQRGDLSDAASWDTPLPPDVIILDADLSEEAVGSEMYREFQLLNFYQCNITGSQTFNGDVYVNNIFSACTWQGGTVTINGRLLLPNILNVLNIKTTSTTSQSVVVHGTTGDDYAVHVSGRINLTGEHSNRHVHFYTGAGKKIGLFNRGYINAVGSSTSRVNFWGANLNSWNGIEAQSEGTRIYLDGGVASTKGIYVYSLGNEAPFVFHLAGNLSAYGILFVRGVRFSGLTSLATQYGVVITSIDNWHYTKYYDGPVVILNNHFSGYEYPVLVEHVYINSRFEIRNNLFEAVWLGVELQVARANYGFDISYNSFNSIVGSAMWLSNVTYDGNQPSGYGVLVTNNTIGSAGAGYGHAINIWGAYAHSGGICKIQVLDNTISSCAGGISVRSLPANDIHCNTSSNLTIRGNNVHSPVPMPDGTSYGIWLQVGDNQGQKNHFVDANTVNGFKQGIRLYEPHDQINLVRNVLLFGSETDSWLVDVFGGTNLTIGGASSKDGNQFGSNHGAHTRHHVADGGSLTTCNHNTISLAGGGIERIVGVTCTNTQYTY